MTRKALSAVAVIAFALLAGGWFALHLRARQAGERLVARAIALDAERHGRVSHAPVPGTLAAVLEPLLATVAVDKEWKEECTAVARGDAPLADLPAGCRAIWERDRVWAVDVLQSSRAESWSRVSRLHDITPVTGGVARLVYAMRLGALEVRQRSADPAVELCVDGLALARDEALGGPLIAVMIATNSQALLARPCAEALARASAEKRAWARSALAAIERGWPAPGAWVPHELVMISGAFYAVMTDEQLARLPAWARTSAYTSGEEPGFFERLALAEGFPGVVAMFERLEKAAALDPSQRNAEAAAIEAAERASWNPLRQAAAPSYQKFFAREDDRREQLRKLIAGEL